MRFWEHWFVTLNNEIKQGQVSFNNKVGFGFFYLNCDKPKITKQVLMQILLHSDFGTCVFHLWVPSFDIGTSRLQLSTWIMIKRLPLEYLQLLHMDATQIGVVIGSDQRKLKLKHP